MTATTTKTPEELMADRVEAAMLTVRDTRYQLMRRILQAGDAHNAMNSRRLRETTDLRHELADVTGYKEQLKRDLDRLQHEIQEISRRGFMHERRASRYLRTLQDLVRLDRSDQERSFGGAENLQQGP